MAEALDIGTLSGRIELEDKLSNVLDQVGGAIGKFDDQFGHVGQTVLTNAASFFTAEAALDALKEAGHLAVEMLQDLVVHGAQVNDVEASFDHLTEASGRLGSSLLGQLKAGTKGTVDDFALVQLANKDLAAGLNLTDQQFGVMAQGAFALSKATGTDVTTALEKMNDSMLRGTTRGVAMLTGKIDLKGAEEAFAASLGGTTKNLTAEGKLEADREAILNAVSGATGRLGDQQVGLGQKLQQGHVFWTNFTDDLGKSVASSPVLAAGIDGIGKAVEAAFGGDQGTMIKTITGYINEAAITVVGLAEHVVDGVGIIGMEWHAALVVFDSVQAGWQAIAYVAESALLLIEKGLNAVSFGSMDNQVKALQADVDGWYNAMAKSQAGIDAHKQAEQDWAVKTGQVKDALEGIRQKMIDADKETTTSAGSVKDLAAQHIGAADAADKHGAAEDKTTGYLKASEEESKKYREAMSELNSVGQTYRDTIDQLDGNIVSAIKYYLDAGIAQDKLAIAYGLTTVQVKAIAEAHKAEVEGLKVLTSAVQAEQQAEDALVQTRIKIQQNSLKNQLADEEAALTARYQRGLISETQYQTQLYGIKSDYANKSEALYQQQEDVQEKAVADGLAKQLADLEAQYNQGKIDTDDYEKTKTEITKTAEDKREAIREQYDADRKDRMRQEVNDLQNVANATGNVGQQIKLLDGEWVTDADVADETLNKTTVMVKTLTGEIISLQEAQKRQEQGGSFNVTSQNFDETVQGFGIDTSAANNLAKQGYSLQEIITYLGTGHGSGPIPPPAGPRIPGFETGGIGDFGAGTLAMLHGKEAIVPLGNPGNIVGGGQVTNHIYVNGTAAEVARKVSDEIMRTLKQQRQFGAA